MIRIHILFLFLFGFIVSLEAQSDRVILSGQVVDSSFLPIPYAAVSINKTNIGLDN